MIHLSTRTRRVFASLGASAVLLLGAASPALAVTTISADIATGGNLTVNGNTILGDTADTDTITLTGYVAGTTNQIVFEGTANTFETFFSVTDPTADRTFTFPNASLTVAGTDLAQSWSAVQTFNGGITAATFSVNPATKDPIIIAPLTGSTGDFSGTVTSDDLAANRTWTFPNATGNVVLDAATQTLTNKTLTAPIFSSIVNTGTLTLPTSTDTLVGRATTDTMTNKTFDTAGAGNVFRINGTGITAVTGTGSAVLASAPTLSAVTTDSLTITGNFFDKLSPLTAAGGGQAGATQIADDIAAVTVNSSGDGVKLPVSFPVGLRIQVFNLHASNALNVYPASSDTINSLSADTAYSLPGLTSLVCVTVTTNTTWKCDRLVSTTTGTGSVVLATSPTLVTPVLGVATATSLNGLTVTTSTGTLTVANSKTLTANNSLTLAGTDSTTITFQGTDTYVGRDTTDTLTNKTLTSPLVNTSLNFTSGGTRTLSMATAAADGASQSLVIAGETGASRSTAGVGLTGGLLTLLGGTGGPANGDTNAGGNGNNIQVTGGPGGVGIATNGPGGLAGNSLVQGGTGGDGTGTGIGGNGGYALVQGGTGGNGSTGGNGGDVRIIPGAVGTGGSPTLGAIRLGSAAATGFKKMQFGTGTCADPATATFTETFAAAPEVVVCSVNADPGAAGATSGTTCNAYTITTSQASVRCRDNAGAAVTSGAFSYVAIDL